MLGDLKNLATDMCIFGKISVILLRQIHRMGILSENSPSYLVHWIKSIKKNILFLSSVGSPEKISEILPKLVNCLVLIFGFAPDDESAEHSV